MRNLELWDVNVRKLAVNDNDRSVVCCYGHSEGSSSGELYTCSYNLILSNLDDDGEIKWTKDLRDIVSSENNAINITYLNLPNALCVGLTNGELFTISNFGTSCELTGVCQAGLLVSFGV